MFALYEKIEDYLNDIKAEVTQDKPIYINFVRTRDENNLVTTEIYIQCISKDNLVLAYKYKKLSTMQLKDLAMYDALLPKEQAEIAKKMHADEIKAIESIHNQKYDELIAGLKSIGFTNFKNALINYGEL